MLKTIILSQVFIANKMFIANKIGSVENSDELIEKFVKLKIKKLFKLKNLKDKTLSKY